MNKQRYGVICALWVMAVCALPHLVGAKSLRLNAQSALLVDARTGKVLFQQNPDTPMQPASITKILTLYLIFDAIKAGRLHLSDRVPISSKAAHTGGSKMFLKTGQRVLLSELIEGIAIPSGNDACVAVAQYMSGDVKHFVQQMNLKARELGMQHSHFVNPNGLPAKGQVTTARDMVKLCRAYLQRFPQALRIHSMHYFTFNRITQHNRNILLWKCPGVDGIKTGWVCAAGYHLAATARRGKIRLIAMVMGAPNPRVRARVAQRLLETGFRKMAAAPPAYEHRRSVLARP